MQLSGGQYGLHFFPCKVIYDRICQQFYADKGGDFLENMEIGALIKRSVLNITFGFFFNEEGHV